MTTAEAGTKTVAKMINVGPNFYKQGESYYFKMTVAGELVMKSLGKNEAAAKEQLQKYIEEYAGQKKRRGRQTAEPVAATPSPVVEQKSEILPAKEAPTAVESPAKPVVEAVAEHKVVPVQEPAPDIKQSITVSEKATTEKTDLLVPTGITKLIDSLLAKAEANKKENETIIGLLTSIKSNMEK